MCHAHKTQMLVLAPVLYGDNYAPAAHVAVCVRAHVCPSPLHIRGEKVEHAVAYMYACRCSVDLRDGTEGNSIDALCTGQLSSGGASKGKVRYAKQKLVVPVAGSSDI